MSKPSDIPQDVWDAALESALDWFGLDNRFYHECARHFAMTTMAERARAIAACEAQKAIFASDEYATPQPLGGLMERFACDRCIEAIRKGTP